MFYTRRIGASPSYTPENIDNRNRFAETKENIPIIGALKLTGTNRRGVTIGVIQSVTARSSAKVWDNGTESRTIVEPLTNYTVARLQKNWKGNTLLGGMLTSVNRLLEEPYLKDFFVRNAFTGGLDFAQYFKNRLYYIEAKGMFSSLQGSQEAITRLQQNAVHYYQRESSADYLRVDPTRTSLNGTGGYVKAGRKGNAKWTFSEMYSWSSPGFDLNDIGYLKETDYQSNVSEIAFRQTDIWKLFRYNAFTLTQKNMWNYGKQAIYNDVAFRWQSMTMNRFEWDIKETFLFNQLDTRLLRGGPDVRMDPSLSTSVKFNTDKAKRVLGTFQYTGNHNLSGYSNYNTISPNLTFRIGNHLYLSGKVDYSWNTDENQYITTIPGTSPDNRYILGRMKQKTYGLTLNMQLNLTPDISIQFYGAPFTSTVKYDRLKEDRATTSHTYEERFRIFTPDEIEAKEGMYYFPGGQAEQGFSFNEFRSNLVARWEYLPGSTLYFVWEHRMSNRDSYSIDGWGKNLDRMFGVPSTNTFMIKINYWFNI